MVSLIFLIKIVFAYFYLLPFTYSLLLLFIIYYLLKKFTMKTGPFSTCENQSDSQI
jgi:hypothetical protein